MMFSRAQCHVHLEVSAVAHLVTTQNNVDTFTAVDSLKRQTFRQVFRMHEYLISCMGATYPAHLILFDLNAVTSFNED
jgi:hypothetical protein